MATSAYDFSACALHALYTLRSFIVLNNNAVTIQARIAA
jgi:hypothetical protein